MTLTGDSAPGTSPPPGPSLGPAGGQVPGSGQAPAGAPGQNGGDSKNKGCPCKCVCECKPDKPVVYPPKTSLSDIAAGLGDEDAGPAADAEVPAGAVGSTPGLERGTAGAWTIDTGGSVGGARIFAGQGIQQPGTMAWTQVGAAAAPLSQVGPGPGGAGGRTSEERGGSQAKSRPRLRGDAIAAQSIAPLRSPIPDGLQTEAASAPPPHFEEGDSGGAQAAAPQSALVAPDYSLRNHLPAAASRPEPVAPPATGSFDLVGERGAPDSGIGAVQETSTDDGNWKAGAWREDAGPVFHPPIDDSGIALDLTEARAALGAHAPPGTFLAASSVGVLEEEGSFEDFQVAPPEVPPPPGGLPQWPDAWPVRLRAHLRPAGWIAPPPKDARPPAMEGLEGGGYRSPLFAPQRESFTAGMSPVLPEHAPESQSAEVPARGPAPDGLRAGASGTRSPAGVVAAPDGGGDGAAIRTGASEPGPGAGPSTSAHGASGSGVAVDTSSLSPNLRPSLRPSIGHKPGSGKGGGISGAMNLEDRAEEFGNFVQTGLVDVVLPDDDTDKNAKDQGWKEAEQLQKDAERAKEEAKKNFSNPDQFENRWKEEQDRRDRQKARDVKREQERENRDPRRAFVKAANGSAGMARDARDRANRVLAASTHSRGDPKKVRQARETAKAARKAAKEAHKAARAAKHAAKSPYATKEQAKKAQEEADKKATEALKLALAAQKQLDDAENRPDPCKDCGPADGCGKCDPPCPTNQEWVCHWEPKDAGGGKKGKGLKAGDTGGASKPKGPGQGGEGGDQAPPRSDIEVLANEIEASGAAEGTSRRARVVQQLIRALKDLARTDTKEVGRIRKLEAKITRLAPRAASGTLHAGDKYQLEDALTTRVGAEAARDRLHELASAMLARAQQSLDGSDRDLARLAQDIDRLRVKGAYAEEFGRSVVRQARHLPHEVADPSLEAARQALDRINTAVAKLQTAASPQQGNLLGPSIQPLSVSGTTEPVPSGDWMPRQDEGLEAQAVQESEAELFATEQAALLSKINTQLQEDLAPSVKEALDRMSAEASRWLDQGELPLPTLVQFGDDGLVPLQRVIELEQAQAAIAREWANQSSTPADREAARALLAAVNGKTPDSSARFIPGTEDSYAAIPIARAKAELDRLGVKAWGYADSESSITEIAQAIFRERRDAEMNRAAEAARLTALVWEDIKGGARKVLDPVGRGLGATEKLIEAAVTLAQASSSAANAVLLEQVNLAGLRVLDPSAFWAQSGRQFDASKGALLDSWRDLANLDRDKKEDRITRSTLGGGTLAPTVSEQVVGEDNSLALARFVSHFSSAASEVSIGYLASGAPFARLGGGALSGRAGITGAAPPGSGLVGAVGEGGGSGLVHLTDEASEAAVAASKRLTGEHGIFAVPKEMVEQAGPLKRAFLTGLKPSKTARMIEIPEAALGEFQRPMVVGPYSAWKYFGGVRFARPGSILLPGSAEGAAGTLVPSSTLLGPRLSIYGTDALIWSTVGGYGYYLSQQGTRSKAPVQPPQGPK